MVKDIVKGSQCKYTFRLYHILRSIANCNNTPILSKWLSYTESILNNAGLGHVWQRQGEGLSDTWIINALKLRLTDIAKQDIMSKYGLIVFVLITEFLRQIYCSKIIC